MLDRFLLFIKKHALIEKNDRVLLAVSGGVDSIVLFNLISQTDYAFAVAHCNFQLRGEQADLDESLVKEACENTGVKFHSTRFQTKNYAVEHGISTQMAARELRFEWFSQLCDEHGYTKIALAHHKDDSIETFFLNLSRGASLKGLRGIQPKNNSLIRPLLDFSKQEIVQFAQAENLEWREDLSNKETHYKRNLVRHELIPVLKKLNPDFNKVMSENIEKLNSRYLKSEEVYDELRLRLIKRVGEKMSINLVELKKSCSSPYDLYELLRQFSFNYPTCQQIFSSLQSKPGLVFKAQDYELTIDRDQLFIAPTSFYNNHQVTIKTGDSQFNISSDIYQLSIQKSAKFVVDRRPENAALDYDLLEFPLTLRVWEEGDKFQPLGMEGHKLISDFLIDLKIPLVDKSNVWVLLSGGEIVWVVGYRISQKFRLKEKTEHVWSAKLI